MAEAATHCQIAAAWASAIIRDPDELVALEWDEDGLATAGVIGVQPPGSGRV